MRDNLRKWLRVAHDDFGATTAIRKTKRRVEEARRRTEIQGLGKERPLFDRRGKYGGRGIPFFSFQAESGGEGGRLISPLRES